MKRCASSESVVVSGRKMLPHLVAGVGDVSVAGLPLTGLCLVKGGIIPDFHVVILLERPGRAGRPVQADVASDWTSANEPSAATARSGRARVRGSSLHTTPLNGRHRDSSNAGRLLRASGYDRASVADAGI
jgi:hypothetical protein